MMNARPDEILCYPAKRMHIWRFAGTVKKSLEQLFAQKQCINAFTEMHALLLVLSASSILGGT